MAKTLWWLKHFVYSLIAVLWNTLVVVQKRTQPHIHTKYGSTKALFSLTVTQDEICKVNTWNYHCVLPGVCVWRYYGLPADHVRFIVVGFWGITKVAFKSHKLNTDKTSYWFKVVSMLVWIHPRRAQLATVEQTTYGDFPVLVLLFSSKQLLYKTILSCVCHNTF